MTFEDAGDTYQLSATRKILDPAHRRQWQEADFASVLRRGLEEIRVIPVILFNRINCPTLAIDFQIHLPQRGSQFQFLGNAFALLSMLRPMRPLAVHPAIPNGPAGRAFLERAVRLLAGRANVFHGW